MMYVRMANSIKRRVLLFLVSILLTVIASAQASLYYYNTSIPGNQIPANRVTAICAGSQIYVYPVVTGAPAGGTYSAVRTGGVGPVNGDVGMSRTGGVIGAGATEPGNYIITYTWTSGGGGRVSTTMTFFQPPIASITSADGVICDNGSFTLNGTVTAYSIWTLRVGNSNDTTSITVNSQNAANGLENWTAAPVNPSQNTIYTLKALWDGNGCSTTSNIDLTGSTTVKVQAIPIAGSISVNASSSTTICSKDSITIDNILSGSNSTNGTNAVQSENGTITYRWEEQLPGSNNWDSANGSSATLTVSKTNSGIAPVFYKYRRYTISTVDGVDCESVATSEITITVLPTPNVTATAENGVICNRDTARVNVTTTLTSDTRFKWTSNGVAGSVGTGATNVVFDANNSTMRLVRY